jgi:predicted ester cyclase
MRITMKGTHKGTFMNMPPSGKQVSVKGIDIVRISGGKAVEHWGLFDSLTMMQQVGAIPTP